MSRRPRRWRAATRCRCCTSSENTAVRGGHRHGDRWGMGGGWRGWLGFGWALGSWKRISCCDYLWLDIFFFVGSWHFYTGWGNMPFIKGTGEDEIFRFPQLGIWHDLVWRWKGFKSLGIMAPTQGEHQCLEQIKTILPRVAGVPFFGLSMSCQSILYIIIHNHLDSPWASWRLVLPGDYESVYLFGHANLWIAVMLISMFPIVEMCCELNLMGSEELVASRFSEPILRKRSPAPSWKLLPFCRTYAQT